MSEAKFKKILFVCTGNICRSAMAEKLFRNTLLENGIETVAVRSAGVAAQAGFPVSPRSMEALKLFRVDGAGHASRPLEDDDVDWADLILTMDKGHQMNVADRFPRSVGKVYLLKSFVLADGNSEIKDPMGRPQHIFDVCAADLKKVVAKLMEKIR